MTPSEINTLQHDTRRSPDPLRDRQFFATCAKGLESLVADELRDSGGSGVAETRAGVAFRGDIRVALKACLWSRMASRILLPIAGFDAACQEALYAGVRTVEWAEHLAAEGTLAITAHCSGSRINHSHFAALKVKDAIVDQFRERYSSRPSVALVRPDLVINLHLHRDRAIVSIDLSGESLHRRGYRREGLAAPLKENLAAAILVRSGWPAIARAGGPLIDPMCGSGTLPIEAALIAGDIAPGLYRDYFGFSGWLKLRPDLWQELLAEARARQKQGQDRIPPIVGFDLNKKSIRAAWDNAAAAGLTEKIHFERRQLTAAGPFPAAFKKTGLVVVNPPYGERLGEIEELRPLYAGIGAWLREHYQGWQAALITSNPELGKEMRLKAHRVHTLYNGPLKCKLLHFRLDPEKYRRGQAPAAPAVLSPGGEMLANRLRKNLRSIGRWAQQQGVDCYRLYDADLPEYQVSIDIHGCRVQILGDPPAKGRSPDKAAQRRKEVPAAVAKVLGISPERIFYTIRRAGSCAGPVPEKVDASYQVQEAGCRFVVTVTGFRICGLDLDYRLIRKLVRKLAAGKNFLNLFAGAGTATVAAALGRANSTVSLTGSAAEMAWVRRNLDLNSVNGPGHQLVQADGFSRLKGAKGKFELILLDPPGRVHSRKKNEKTFDLQRDHVQLIRSAARLLAPGGTLLFATHYPGFVMDRTRLAGLQLRDISGRTLPRDFARSPGIHSCWEIVSAHRARICPL